MDGPQLYFWYTEREGTEYMYRVWDYLRETGAIESYKTRDHKDVKYDPVGYLYDYVTTFRDTEWIASIPNYNPSILPLWLASVLGKRTTFFISTPRWDRDMFESWDWFDIPFRRSIWRRYLGSHNTTVVTFNESAQAGLEDELGVESTVIPSTAAPDGETFRPLETVERRDPPTILFVGRLVPEKGVEYLLEVAEANSDVDFWFCGDGPLVDAVTDRADERPNVQYKGYVEDERELAELYNRASVLAHPVRRTDRWMEYFGGVIVESLLCGTPVVATDHPGPKSILDEETGIVVPEADTNTFERSLIELAKDSERCDRMGRRGRALATREFALRSVAEKWLEAVVGDDRPVE